MKELLESPWKEFKDGIDKISDIRELQMLLWALEDEYVRLDTETRNRGNIKIADVRGPKNLDSLGEEEKRREQQKMEESKKAFMEIPNIMLIKRKIAYCRETLLMTKNKKRIEISDSIPRGEFRDFSFGIQQDTEPQKLFDAECMYRQANRRIKGNMSVTVCGDLKWYNIPDLNIEQIQQMYKSTTLPVSPKSGNSEKITYDIGEIKAAVDELEKTRGHLKLVNVHIDSNDDKDASPDYFMLMSFQEHMNWKDPKVQEFFIQTYLSTTYRSLVAKASKTGECLYGGRIMEDSDGKMEVGFFQDEVIAAAKANKVLGTTIEPNGRKRRQNLKNMIIGIRNNLSNRAIQNAFGEEGDR